MIITLEDPRRPHLPLLPPGDIMAMVPATITAPSPGPGLTITRRITLLLPSLIVLLLHLLLQSLIVLLLHLLLHLSPIITITPNQLLPHHHLLLHPGECLSVSLYDDDDVREPDGYVAHTASASVTIEGAAPAAVPAIRGGYAASGRFIANNAGVVHEA